MNQAERLDYLKQKYPNIPDYALPIKRGKRKSKANQLTDDILKHLKLNGGIGYRINSQGQFDNRLQKWRHSGSKLGLPDIFAILPAGKFIGIEIKIGKDKLSEYQQLRRGEIIKAGGIFLVARDLDGFKVELQTLLNNE